MKKYLYPLSVSCLKTGPGMQQVLSRVKMLSACLSDMPRIDQLMHFHLTIHSDNQ